MSWNDPSGLRKAAAKQFVDAFLEGDQGAVVDFDSSAIIKVHLTKDKDKIKTAIDTIDSYGGTNIDSAVNNSIDELTSSSSSPTSKKIVILLTDGVGDYNFSTTQRAIDNEIQVNTVSLGYDTDSSLLQNIAGQTGGKFYQIAQSSDLLDAFKRIQDDTIGTIDTTDTDGDGIYDVVEKTGFRLSTGEIITTDPNNPDTDGDGISDGVELGSLVASYDYGYGNGDNSSYYDGTGYPNSFEYDDGDETYSPINIDIAGLLKSSPSTWLQGKVIDALKELGIDTSAFLNNTLNTIITEFGLEYITKEDLNNVLLGIITSIDDNIYFGISQKIANLINGFKPPEDDHYYMMAKFIADTIFATAFLKVAGATAIEAARALVTAVDAGALGLITSETGVGFAAFETVAGVEVIEAAGTLVVSAVADLFATRATSNAYKSSVKYSKTTPPKLTPSKILRNNLKKSGIKPPKFFNAAHHIIPEGVKTGEIGKVAERARQILEKCGIDINGAENGVFLPGENGIAAAGNATVHQGMHSGNYIKEVTRRLEQVNPTNYEDCKAVLKIIKQDLLNGKLKLNN